jgi:hypothetical protein
MVSWHVCVTLCVIAFEHLSPIYEAVKPLRAVTFHLGLDVCACAQAKGLLKFEWEIVALTNNILCHPVLNSLSSTAIHNNSLGSF